MKSLLVFLLVANFCLLVSSFPVTEDTTDGDLRFDTTTVLPNPSIEVNIRKATERINKLNKNIIESLADTMDSDAHSTIGSYADLDALSTNASTNSSSTGSLLTNSTGSDASDQKFSFVLKDLEEFEDHLRASIRNFTTTRQFAYGTMLRPMLQQVQQLKTNLTHLRNHMIGYHAVTELQKQVSALTTELGDAITSTRPGPQTEAEMQSMPSSLTQDSFSWVSE